MKFPELLHSVPRRFRRLPVLYGGIALVGVALAFWLLTRSSAPQQVFSTYEAKRGDFLISIIEGGTLEAVNEVSIRSEVEGTARIIFIVPEGSNARKGDKLVELDSSASQDTVNQQEINVEKAQFALVQSEQQLEIQKSVVESEIQAATLRVEFADSDLEKFMKGEALQAERNAQIEITNVLESLQIAQERLDWSERLYKDGFETKGNLDKDRLTVSQTKLKLEQTQKALWMVVTFDNPKKKRSLESALQEAKENLDRVKLQGERKLAQFKADVDSQKRTLELSQTKLERDKRQLQATKIFAPKDGLVVYAGAGGGRFSGESMIEEGAVVRYRQEIIKLPDVSAMKLQVKIHESHINQVRLGQPSYVVLDSIPDQRFRGVVNKVAPLPDSQSRWGNPDLKVYATEILVTDKLPDIKPGVSARAEVIITNLPNALTVPIQAVTTRKGKQVVFLAGAPNDPIPVTVGLFNTKFIEITTGIKPGDTVLLAPPFDTKEKDLGGAIIAEGDALPAGSTNKTANLSQRPPQENPSDGLPGASSVNLWRSRTNDDLAIRSGTVVGMDHAESAALQEQRPGGAQQPAAREGIPEGKRNRPGRGELGVTAAERQEIFKRFDTNGDGNLDEGERAAMRDWLNRQRGTNAPPRGTL
jgi:HlyD family secretion protein